MKNLDLLSSITYTISKIIPKKRNRWVFGAWFGSAISDNTKAFYDYVNLHYPDIEKIWVVNDTEKHHLDGCKFVRRNSLKSLMYITTAKVAVMNQGYGDFNALNFLGNCYSVQLWHGIAWKKIVLDSMPDLSKHRRNLFKYSNNYSLYVATSEMYRDVLLSAFDTDESKVVMAGQPRNEVLFDEDFCKRSREEVQKRFSLNKNEKIVVYMPTFRDKTNEVFSFFKDDVYEKVSKIGDKLGFVVLEKSHYKNSDTASTGSRSRIISALGMEANTLLASADMLITDYSSCFFDYLIRKKPIIHYIYDYDYYKNKDRGLYYEIDKVAAGDVAFNLDELLKTITDNIESPELRSDVRDRITNDFINFEKPGASAIICERIMHDVYNGELLKKDEQ